MATEKYHGRTEAQRRADARYKDKHFDRVATMVPKGHRAIYQAAAKECGLSWRQFIIDSMNQYIKNNLPSFPLQKMIEDAETMKDQENENGTR